MDRVIDTVLALLVGVWLGALVTQLVHNRATPTDPNVKRVLELRKRYEQAAMPHIIAQLEAQVAAVEAANQMQQSVDDVEKKHMARFWGQDEANGPTP